MIPSASVAKDIDDRIAALSRAMSHELTDNIVPFWLALRDRSHGGHYGHMDLAGNIDRMAPKSAVFVARLLWTLSEVGRATGDGACLEQAEQTKAFLLNRVLDRARGGLFWAVTNDGRPADTSKHLYAQAFGIYALSAHAAAVGDLESLGAAKELFVLVETRCRNPGGGYAEAFDAAWRPVDNGRLAPQGGIGTMTANSHLHLVEAYTALTRVWSSPGSTAALRALVQLFLTRFLSRDGTSLHQTLDPALRPLPGAISYGHDIEASWLLEDAGDIIGDPALSSQLRDVAATLAAAAAVRAQIRDGGFLSGPLEGAATTLPPRVWWVQAEAIVGLVNAAQRANAPEMLMRAEAVWNFVERTMIDRQGGDWFDTVDGNGRPDPRYPKVGPWKDSYHQSRACLEIARRAARANVPSAFNRDASSDAGPDA